MQHRAELGQDTTQGLHPDKLRKMWEDAKEQAGFYGSDDYKHVLRALRPMQPDALTDGSEFNPDMRIPAGCLLEQQIGIGRAREINRMLAVNKHTETVRLWARYADQYAIADSLLPKGAVAHFNPDVGGISINLDEIGKAKPGYRPYSVFLHKSSHMLNWILAKNSPAEYYSSVLHDGRSFKMTLDADARAWMRAEIAKISHGTAAERRTKALQAISETLYLEGGDDSLAAHDMIQAALGDDYSDISHTGHARPGYFAVAGSQEAEAFAEMMETQLSNPVGWKLIERHFPASVKMFEVITKEAMKQ